MSEFPRRMFFLRIFFLLLCLGFVVFINNTIPYFTLPTMGQALWAMGYAKSLANGGIFNVYASDIGIPEPAAIAFGLSAVLPISYFIKLGVLPEAAYSLVFSVWLFCAFYGAYRLTRHFGINYYISCLFSVLWLITPVITKHSGYSMLSLGVALLPFYCWRALAFSLANERLQFSFVSCAVLYVFTAMISIFMDGYTFMMFAVAGTSIILFGCIRSDNKYKYIIYKLPVHLLAFAISYELYSLFIGKTAYQAEPIEFFRGWGLDVIFLAIPTEGIFWLADSLHLSSHRLSNEYFGDASVWETSYSLPFIVLGILGWFKYRKEISWLNCFILIGLFSFYMALGPSLKINSLKPDNYSQINTLANTMLMPSNYAVMPTGNALISENLPGFNVMRASYRWVALGLFMFWLLTAKYISGKNKFLQYLAALFLIALYLPHLQNSWNYGRAYFFSVGNINDTLVEKLRHDVPPQSKVAFIPWNNDFFANYLAPFSGFKTFNIGGDKNLSEAKEHWPMIMGSLQGALTVEQTPYVIQLLLDKNVDYIVIPYVNMLWSAHYWKCPHETLLPLKTAMRTSLVNDLHFLCPDKIKSEYTNILQQLKMTPFITVMDNDLYALIGIDEKKFKKFINSASYDYPLIVDQNNYELTEIFKEGWYYLEEHHAWSHKNAEIQLNVPSSSVNYYYFKYNVLLNDKDSPVVVYFKTYIKGQPVTVKKVIDDNNSVITPIPIDHGNLKQNIIIEVKNAKSPAELGIGSDSRILGISLQNISIGQ